MFNQKKKEKQIVCSIIVFIITFGLAVFAYVLLSRDRILKSEKVLKLAKESFKAEGPIEGSWIEMTVDTYTHNGEEIEVYHGGVTRTVDGQTTQIEFVADAYTGEVLSTKEI